jgi:hypothetical protein
VIDRFEISDTDGRKLDSTQRRAVREAIWSGSSTAAGSRSGRRGLRFRRRVDDAGKAETPAS